MNIAEIPFWIFDTNDGFIFRQFCLSLDIICHAIAGGSLKFSILHCYVKLSYLTT